MQSKLAKKTEQSVIKSAIYFAFGTFLSRFAGLFREAALVAVFDKTISDAWQAAFRFPNLFRRIFGEGALSVCFIPVYVELKERHQERARAELTAGILGLLLVILIPLSIVIIGTMDLIIPVWVGGKGFSSVPGKIELTILLTKWMFPFLILVSIYAYFMALLNAHKKFLLTSVAPSLLNISIIASFAYAHLTGKVSVLILLGGAVLVGGLLQIVIISPTFLNCKYPMRGHGLIFESTGSSSTQNFSTECSWSRYYSNHVVCEHLFRHESSGGGGYVYCPCRSIVEYRFLSSE
ncbi:MAG: hypothetical protein H6623_05535 [Bdellovibrionaceae bacterium]|nr:hypothetical protein [Pseudobdellovibrionaceae bacterium]